MALLIVSAAILNLHTWSLFHVRQLSPDIKPVLHTQKLAVILLFVQLHYEEEYFSMFGERVQQEEIMIETKVSVGKCLYIVLLTSVMKLNSYF